MLDCHGSGAGGCGRAVLVAEFGELEAGCGDGGAGDV